MKNRTDASRGRYISQNSNQVSFKYESGALLPERAVLVTEEMRIILRWKLVMRMEGSSA
jgi:hypothetical protein